MISITQIFVRDTDKKSDTAITLNSGGTLDLSKCPKNWTLDFAFSGKFRQVSFVVDGKPVHIEEAAPYCPAGDNSPINLAVGSHRISVTIDSQPAVIVQFNVVQNAVNDTQLPTSAFGTNGDGISKASGDPILHPQLVTACKTYGFEFIRLWTEGDFKTPFASSYWKIPLAWAAVGLKVIAVLNFQNSPGKSAPGDADWLMKINSLPDAKDSGVWGICIGNEVDTATYYTGTVAQLVHLVQIAYPILKAKGYVVIAPSFIMSLQNVRSFVAAMGTDLAFDYLDYHVYAAGADLALSQIDAYQAYCSSISKPGMVSECGIRGVASNLVGWSNQIEVMFSGLKTRAGIYLQFPLYWLPESSDPLCQMAVVGKDSASANEPFAGVWGKVVAAG